MKKYYYTIGEVANLLELKTHVLRYWEKEFPQVHPKKKFGRNRKYSPDDIEILKKIKYMLHIQGFTIDGAKKKLKEEMKHREQLNLDFSLDKKKLKNRIKEELLEVKKILSKE
ncbi:MAG: MerR family transcriptional regulator [Candidatus Cloacimonetes bacterium]|nr:MerR family transcriptional regulator [Candidatus Cloacimonadota bacterium]